MDDATVTTEEVRARELARMMLTLVNNYGHDEAIRAFSDEVRKGHRTLQQTLFKAIVVLLLDWSEDCASGRYDGRNEFTVKTSEKLVRELIKAGAIYECQNEQRVTVPFI